MRTTTTSPKAAAHPITVHSAAIDDVALAALRARWADAEQACARCELCDAPIAEAPAASGLLLWARGGEVRADEPPLCAACAASIAAMAFATLTEDDEAEE